MSNFSNNNRAQRERQPRRNEQIRTPMVRLVGPEGEPLGVKPIQEALLMARDRGLDLVEIAAQADPPVAKIMNYSKFMYDQEKKKREARKKQKAVVLKEIVFKPRIASHDFETKVNHIEEFLAKKDRVKVTVVFRGRENQFRSLGEKLLSEVQAKFADLAVIERDVPAAGNRISITLTPKQAT